MTATALVPTRPGANLAPSSSLIGAAKQSGVTAAGSAKPASSGPASPSTVLSPSLQAALASSSASSSTPSGPSADGSLIAGGGHVTARILASDSSYENKIYYSTDNFATRHLIGVDNHQATVDLGEFAKGTKIDFGIDNGQGNFFRTGGASANRDGVVHAQVGSNGQIGFEDLNGGGDRDYNDAMLQVSSENKGAQPPVAPPAKNDNRSGLGDGTNAGQGVGKANTPNTGTSNPGKPAPAPVAAAPAPKSAPIAIPSPAKPPVSIPVLTGPKNESSNGNKPTPVISAPPAPVPATPTVTSAPKNDNRSGLGDGTNPGQGAGKVNSPNTGTLNPNQSGTPKTVAIQPAVTAKAPVQVAAPKPVTAPAAPLTAQLEANKRLLAAHYGVVASNQTHGPTAARAA